MPYGKISLLRAVDGDAAKDVITALVDHGKAVEGLAEAAVRGAYPFLAVDGDDHGAEGVAGPFDDVGALIFEDQRPGDRADDTDAASRNP